MLKARGYAPADTDLLIRTRENNKQVLAEISKDRDPGFDALAEALQVGA